MISSEYPPSPTLQLLCQYLATSVVDYTDLSRHSTVYFHVEHLILGARTLKPRSLMEFKPTKFLSYIHSLCYSVSNETSA